MKQIFPQKGFFHENGNLIELPVKSEHSTFVANNPHIFNTSEDELKKSISSKQGVKFSEIKDGVRTWDDSVDSLHKAIGNKGFMRLNYERTENTSASQGEDFATPSSTHRITISHHGDNVHPENFQESLKLVKSKLSKIGPDDNFSVTLLGFTNPETLKTHLERNNLPQIAQRGVILNNMSQINQFLGERSHSGIQRNPVNQAQVANASQIRASFGKKPESMTQAEWNFYTGFGESTEKFKFSTLLEKIKENKCKTRKN